VTELGLQTLVLYHLKEQPTCLDFSEYWRIFRYPKLYSQSIPMMEKSLVIKPCSQLNKYMFQMYAGMALTHWMRFLHLFFI